MPNLVIVAIPEENDYVNRISSEKVAHMTLCFLGDVTQVRNIAEIFSFVKHAADISLQKFGMEVDRRGELGPDNADVLFFSQSKWSGYETINAFRSNLLKDNNVRTAYDSTTQFPEWVPHLTLGYPEAPANPDTRDYPGIQYVNFDRIGIWFNDFDGIEIPLKSQSWDVVSMGVEDVLDEILEHHGIKGMRWGVRSASSGGASRAANKMAKKDKKFEKKASDFNTHVAIHNATHVEMTKFIEAHNKKYAKAIDEGHMLKENDPINKKYTKEYVDEYMKQLNHQASLMKSPSGNKQYRVLPSDYHALGFMVEAVDVKHDSSTSSFKVEIERDDTGAIIGLRLANDTMAQGALVVGDILEHHGVKGMRWGVRKSDSQGGHSLGNVRARTVRQVEVRRAQARSPEVTVRDKGKKLKTSGGKGLPAHADAVRVRTIGQKGKKSGLKALSDKELRDYASRLQLEQNVHRLNHNEKSAGKRFISGILKTQGSRAAKAGADAVGTAAGKSALRIAIKRSAKVAAVAAV